jgi:hypothetical protein
MTPYSSEKQNSKLRTTLDSSKENVKPLRPSASSNIGAKRTMTIQSERKSTARELTDLNLNQMNEFDGQVGGALRGTLKDRTAMKINELPSEDSRTPVGQSKFTEISYKIFRDMEVRSSDRFPKAKDSNDYLLLSHRKIKLLEESKQSDRKVNPAELSRRLYEEKFELENNNKALGERYREEMMKECTFKPSIHRVDTTDECSITCSPEEFYKNQLRRKLETQEKMNMLLQEKEQKLASDITIQPEITKVRLYYFFWM